MTSYDKKINNIFYNWLLFSFFLVFIMVVVGGLTRLTNSGLSITEWELFSGILPPLNKQNWENYFQLYKETPQYKILYNSMTLSEFKIIFYWEYVHRILGRIIGLFFLIPLIFFLISKKIEKNHLSNCVFIMFLILIQGLVGWYMVKSGLVNNVSVSHYRLSLHLIIAFIIISMIFWIIINVKFNTSKFFLNNSIKSYPYYFLIFLIFLQIIIGAFVSGLDAGKIFQTWPMMNQSYFPNDTIINTFVDLTNFNNHGLVQFYHRNIAYFIIFYILVFGLYIYFNNPTVVFNSYLKVLFFLTLQIIVGISTLVSGLNIYLASIHQILSLILVLTVINLYYQSIK